MRILGCLTAVVILSLTIPLNARKKPDPAPAPPVAAPSGRLPVTRVVLYKNGVGYFEHSAQVRGSQELSIDFTTAQLNDVLKSLTVLDLDGGQIAGIRYNSIAPLSERLRTLRLPLSTQTTEAEFLNAIRGSEVEVRSATGVAQGRVLSVETRTQRTRDQITQSTELSVISDTGELHTFQLGPGTTVHVTDPELDHELGRYLDAVSSLRAGDLRRMTISTSGKGDRQLFVSYISEVPVWKSTYRILLPSKPGESAILQGWAIVDDTIGEDWNNVRLSLVAGAPQSFIQEISQPLYARRPEVPLPETAMLTPQTHAGTMVEEKEAEAPAAPAPTGQIGGVYSGPTGSLQGRVTDPSGAVVANAQVSVTNNATGASQSTVTDATGTYHFSAVPTGASTLRVSLTGFRTTAVNFYANMNTMNQVDATLQVGANAEAVEVRAEPAQIQTSLSMLASTQQAAASAKAVGDLFEYDVQQKITIGQNQSALVPIIQAQVDAEKVTLWTAPSGDDDNDDAAKAHPALRALWLKNTSGLTLDAGTFNVLDADTFAGEGLLDPIHANERRLLSYAADPAIRVEAAQEGDDMPIARVQIAKGMMTSTYEQRRTTTYTIRNSDTSPRQVILEHPLQEDWELMSGLKPEETSNSTYRFRVQADAGKTTEFKVQERHPTEAGFALTNLTNDQVVLMMKQKRVTPAMQEAFNRILTQKNEITDLDRAMATRQQEVQGINADQGRLRENMKALKGSAEEKALLLRYTRALNREEDRLNVLGEEITQLKKKREMAGKSLDQLVMGVNLDQTF